MNISKRMYNLFAKNYRDYSNARKKYLASVDEIIIGYTKKTNFKNIILCDLGAGDGIRSYNLTKQIKVQKLILIDESEEMYKLCQKISRATSLNESFSSMNLSLKPQSIHITVSLWNVFGHLASEHQRLIGLKNIEKTLVKGGLAFIDVNNRYNVKAYGLKNVIRNVFKDIFKYSSNNGDVKFSIKANGQTIPAFVHISHPWELDPLIKKANLVIKHKLYIDYDNGKISTNPFMGQILYILVK